MSFSPLASPLDFSGTDMNARLGASLTTGITGTGTLTFSGPGMLTLNAANTYNGGTTVSAGTLAIGASDWLMRWCCSAAL